jgi:hypothetical protein
MLPRNQRMELLSKAYIRALAAQAGGLCVTPNPDFGLDFSIHFVAHDGGFFDEGAVVDIQLKSTTTASFDASQQAHRFDLDVRAYNHLRKDPINAPRLLVLFIMPDDEALWLSQDHEGLVLRSCAYYLSLQGMPETKNERTIRISVPRAQIFSVEFLQRQFQERRKQ